MLTTLLDGHPDAVVAHHDGITTTRGELQQQAATLAELVDAHQLGGSAIGVCMPNVPATIAAWFGAWQAGAAFVPLNPRAPDAEVARAIETVGVAAVVTPEGLHVCDGVTRRAVRADDAIIQFTSGTTGRPKAVPLRHDTVGDLLDTVIRSLRGGRSDATHDRTPMPNIVPMSLSLWAGIYQVLFAFRLGAPVVLMREFAPAEFARLVREHDIKSSVLPPAALVMLMQDPDITSLAPLRYVRSVSAPLSPAQARRFHERFGIAILNGYGQTELGGEAIGWTAEDWKTYGVEKLGAVGRPHAAFELRVRGSEGALVGADDIGELEIRSSSALPPEDATMEGRVTDDGWLRTGDLARIDHDGFVWIEGRVSAMINRGGLKVFPDEVEEQLRGYDPVDDVAVVGTPDERLGEVPWAFVVSKPGHSVDADALRDWCRARMAPYKIPVGVTVVDTLPRNEIGKVLRNELVASPGRDG
jgi:long-chain acyl-CoA synthetase